MSEFVQELLEHLNDYDHATGELLEMGTPPKVTEADLKWLYQMLMGAVAYQMVSDCENHWGIVGDRVIPVKVMQTFCVVGAGTVVHVEALSTPEGASPWVGESYYVAGTMLYSTKELAHQAADRASAQRRASAARERFMTLVTQADYPDLQELQGALQVYTSVQLAHPDLQAALEAYKNKSQEGAE